TILNTNFSSLTFPDKRYNCLHLNLSSIIVFARNVLKLSGSTEIDEEIAGYYEEVRGRRWGIQREKQDKGINKHTIMSCLCLRCLDTPVERRLVYACLFYF